MTLAAIKRRIRPGVTLLCVQNTYRPVLNDRERTVTKVQTNGFWWKHVEDERASHTHYPPARDVTSIDGDTFRLALGMGDAFVELRFLTNGGDS